MLVFKRIPNKTFDVEVSLWFVNFNVKDVNIYENVQFRRKQ